MSGDRARGRSVYCAPEIQDAIRARSREADMPHSRLIVELARADDPDRHPLVLTEAEQRAMRDDLAECAALVRALGQTNRPCSRRFDASTSPVPSHHRTLTLSARLGRNTTATPEYGSRPSSCSTTAASPS
ncbi:MAG: hypothetical protein OXU81_03245 [Gammaproteobacteria bacterium]|nr:hypothetical protein [Gammaproteobacteria bacterium]